MSILTASYARQKAEQLNDNKLSEEWTLVERAIIKAMNNGEYSVDVQRLQKETVDKLISEPRNFKVEVNVQTGMQDYNDRISW